MLTLLIALTGSPLTTPISATCPAEFEARALKFERPPKPSAFYPEKTDMPDTTVQLVCRVGANGKLNGCAVRSENPAGWGFGEWARAEASRWRVLTQQVQGCPVIGHPVSLTVRSRDR